MGSSSNGSLCEISLNKRPLENGCCTSSNIMLKYKKRKVSAVRDFPPGCGWNATRINQLPHNTEAAASLGDEEKLVADEKMVNVANGDCIKTSEIGNRSLSHQVGDKEKLVADEKVSAVRDFPPGCGQNAPHINQLPHNTEAAASLGDKEKLVADEEMVNVANGDCVKTSEIGNGSLSHLVGDKEKLVADEKMVNVANSDCTKTSEIGNESFSHQVVNSLGKLEMVDSLDDLVGRVVAAAGVVKVELSPVKEPLGSDLPKVLVINAPELPKELHEVEVPAVVKSDGALESKSVLEIGSLANGIVPAGGAKVWSPPQWPISDANISKETALKNNYPRRRVSATRDFPPFCGRNALCPTEEERLRIVFGNKTSHDLDKAPVQGGLVRETVRGNGECSPVTEIARTGVEELGGAVQVGNSRKRELKESVPELKIKSRKVSVQGGPLVETPGADMEGSQVRETTGAVVEELCRDVPDGNTKKRKLEGSVPEPKTKSQKVIKKDYEDVNGVKGEVGKEIVVYIHDKGSKSSRPDDAVALGHGADRVIVQGLMAAPNCPWRQVKGIVNTSQDIVRTGSEVMRHDISYITGRKKSKSVSRTKKYEADYSGGKSTKKKKLHPYRNHAYESKGQLVVKDEGDFSIQEQDEDSPVAPRPQNFEVALPPFGPNSSSHGNARVKVRETLRLFQAICRKLLQGEEAKPRQQGCPSKRIDLLASQIVRAKGKEANTGKNIIGSVPGVEVGDEFQYRVELALVGIHRLYQAGIDYINQGGMIIVTSIVASGGYADDLDNPDVLIYSGQGGTAVGRDKQHEDQKLERGNLALKNSITANNPVRVIRGSKETKASNSEARAKIVLTTYIYDGLYTVKRYWHDVGPHGKLVFKFELTRIPGQPELAWKEVKKSNKYKIREGRCVDDISGGKELFPICAVNTIDNEKPPTFNYMTQMKYPDWFSPIPPQGCDCIGGCLDSQKCSCVLKNGGEIPYNYNGAIVESKTLVYECGPSCKCPPSCYNRVSQHGIKIQLEIFKTESRGWGVRSLTSIPSGSFICEYIGELLEDAEAEKRHNDEYLFDIGQNYCDCSVMDELSTLKPDAQSTPNEVVEDGFTIDAAECANVGRFVNHSCSPNLYAQNVLYDHEDKKMPHIMFFAAENIPPLQELTYHYNYSVDEIRDSNGNIKKKNCYCGSEECTGRMY
ncbi:Histone-lysine N-methyltransferase, H3 lysine-9 specific SUVH5 [Camellia lanceoleosa]|nr:Histone-lysine N-methyltransferase, H3 lysine-9 specific SUVH5 [Camellia lanceoleosa]